MSGAGHKTKTCLTCGCKNPRQEHAEAEWWASTGAIIIAIAFWAVIIAVIGGGYALWKFIAG